MNKRILAIGTTVLGASLLCSAVSVAPALAATPSTVTAAAKSSTSTASATLLFRHANQAFFTVKSTAPDEYIAKAFVGGKEVGSIALSEGSTLAADLGSKGFLAQDVTVKVGAQHFRTVKTFSLPAVTPNEVPTIDGATVVASTASETTLRLRSLPGAKLVLTSLIGNKPLGEATANSQGISRVVVANADVEYNVVRVVQTYQGVTGEEGFVRTDEDTDYGLSSDPIESLPETVAPAPAPAPAPAAAQAAAPSVSVSNRTQNTVFFAVTADTDGDVVVRDASGNQIGSGQVRGGKGSAAASIGSDAASHTVTVVHDGVESAPAQVEVPALAASVTVPDKPTVSILRHSGGSVELRVVNAQAGPITVRDADGTVIRRTFEATKSARVSVGLRDPYAATRLSVTVSVKGVESAPTVVDVPETPRVPAV
ncbi:hypothetical protein [Curtobacterium sp. Leaf261]|uniref:hypothetical protein n=1 Tax=Curtobacterium sp. Leaf261 TaxID=1736311 RepID=UPI0006F92DF7|nr:hypothetical protein [Curtobacterium sp. Leaf261]KQO63764.1 hypothetical protein ASF23_06000 [Curtobacterium sp. Leaf261]